MDRRAFLQSLSALGAFVFAGGKPARPSKTKGSAPMTSLVNSVASTLGSGAGTFTLSFDAGSTPNRVLHVFDGDTTVASMTYGGHALLDLDNIGPKLWELINPPSGINTLSVTYSGGSAHAVVVLAVDNVNQDLPWQWGLATAAGLTFNGITTPFLPTTDMYCITVKSSGSGNTLASTDGTLTSLANLVYGTSKIAVAGTQGTGSAFDGRWQVNSVTNAPNWVVVYRPFGQALTGWSTLVSGQFHETGANNAFYAGQNIESVTATAPAMTKVAANNGIMAAGIDGSGNLYTWGSDNGSGMLGDGTAHLPGAFYQLVPTLVSGVTTAVDVTVALTTLFFLKSDGTVWYFGRDVTIGPGITNHTSATQVAGLSNIARIDNGGGQNCLLALDGTGNLWFVGNNGEAQAGNGSSSGMVATPYNVLSSVVDFALSEEHAVACVTGGAVYCWGNNDSKCTGQGINTGFTTTPTVVSGPSNVIQVSCQDTPSTLVLTNTNQIWHWGSNFEGEAGDGTSGTSNIAPHQITMPAATYTTLVRDARAFGEVYVITSTGLVYTWGANFWGGQGRNGYNQVLTPTLLFPSLLKGVKSLAVSGDNGWYVLINPRRSRAWVSILGLI